MAEPPRRPPPPRERTGDPLERLAAVGAPTAEIEDMLREIEEGRAGECEPDSA